jgi:uncharacterized OsmC-like protein
MEIKVRHLGDTQFEAEARGHRVVSDQPPDNGGYDEGLTPPEFLLISLGTCVGFYIVQYLNAHSLNCPELEVKVAADKWPPSRRAWARSASKLSRPPSIPATRPACCARFTNA